jgi:hypothetical protein
MLRRGRAPIGLRVRFWVSPWYALRQDRHGPWTCALYFVRLSPVDFEGAEASLIFELEFLVLRLELSFVR